MHPRVPNPLPASAIAWLAWRPLPALALALVGSLVLVGTAGRNEERLLEGLDAVAPLHLLDGLEEEELAAVE